MHPFGVIELLQSSATVAPSGSGHAFASGQILNPYATRYRQPFAFSTIPYPLIQQVALRLPCQRACACWQTVGLTTFPDLPTWAIHIAACLSG